MTDNPKTLLVSIEYHNIKFYTDGTYRCNSWEDHDLYSEWKIEGSVFFYRHLSQKDFEPVESGMDLEIYKQITLEIERQLTEAIETNILE